MTDVIRRDTRYAFEGDTSEAEKLAVGDRVWLAGTRRAWNVRARTERYVICTQPFNLKRTVLYTVIDLALGIRGTDNYGGLGYDTDEEIARAAHLFSERGIRTEYAEISVRNNVKLVVERVELKG